MAAAAPAVDPAIAATIDGRVVLNGAPPPAEAIDMSDEPACADVYGETGPMTQAVVGENGGLGNVFVYVKEGLEGTFPAPSEPAILDQQGCRYHPHVLGIQVGQDLLIRNDDPLLHNINTQPSVNRGFNVSQPQAGMESTRRFRSAEVMIPVKCDVHGWMNAYIGVLEHPYFAVSEDDGAFTIGQLPPGDYVLEAWHELYGTATQTVTVGEAETATVTFEFNADVASGKQAPLGTPLDPHPEHGAAPRAAAR
ncbi:MAG: carboxypeptidase regulatory-like domain-containing protein [Gemmatimonadota bacterium]